jgi:hypothetical protein
VAGVHEGLHAEEEAQGEVTCGHIGLFRILYDSGTWIYICTKCGQDITELVIAEVR